MDKMALDDMDMRGPQIVTVVGSSVCLPPGLPLPDHTKPTLQVKRALTDCLP